MIQWNDKDVALILEVLGRHRRDQMPQARAEIARRLGLAHFTKSQLLHLLARRGLGSPYDHLGRSSGESIPAPPIQSAVPDDTPDGDASEFAEAGADWDVVMPDGHRLRGNSTLLDANDEIERRWVKTERDSKDPPDFQPIPDGHLIKKVSTLLDGQGQVRAQWIQAPKDEQTRWDEFWSACKAHVESYRGISELSSPPTDVDERLLTIYPLGDPHIGMLSWAKETGEDFDLKIAERDLASVVDMLVARAPSSKRAILANVGDFFHAETDEQRTPANGHKLDCDTRMAKMAGVGFMLVRRLIDNLLAKHELVDAVNVPGNHDPKLALMLSMWLAAVYEKEPRVRIVDNRNPFIYLRHGKCLLGFAHGHNTKLEQLPAIMATDRASDWGEAIYRMWITGHIHHLTRRELPGCIVESFRTLAPKDYWHNSMGYRSGQSLSCITLDTDFGEVTRSTVDLRLSRAMAAS